MKMYFLALALIFITRLRFPPHRSLYSIILSRYDCEGLRAYRFYEKSDFKLRKSRADLEFLDCCQTNNLTPKFLRFKLYSKNITNNTEYRSYQKRLLIGEIGMKKARIASLEHDCFETYNREL